MKFLAAVMLVSIALALTACRKGYKPAPAPQDASPASIGSLEWPIFRGDQGLRGLAQGRLPHALRLKWKFKTNDAVRSSPVIADGTVFVGSDDGYLYAIDATAGTKLWSFRTADAVEAPPLVLDGTVYAGSRDTFFYAVDAHTGQLKWKYETDAEITGSANWTRSPDGRQTWIVVGSHDYKLYCFDPPGNVVWTYESDNFINGAPAVDDGKVFFGGCDALIHEVSLTDGTSAGRIETGSYIAASAAVLDDRIYVGNYDSVFVCADRARRNLVWEFTQAQDAFFSSPALTDEAVLVGCRDDHLYRLARTDGAMVWSFQAKDDVDSSPVVCGDSVVFGCGDGRLYMVRLDNGALIWSYDAGRPITSSPAIAAGLVVVGCDDGCVYAFGQ